MTTITLGGVLISLELIMRDCFTMGLFNGNELHGYAALAGLLVLIVLPLSMQAKMSLLSRSSFISVLAILYMIGVLVYLGGLNAATGGEALSASPLPSPSRMLGAAPVVIYSLGCQVQAVVSACTHLIAMWFPVHCCSSCVRSRCSRSSRSCAAAWWVSCAAWRPLPWRCV